MVCHPSKPLWTMSAGRMAHPLRPTQREEHMKTRMFVFSIVALGAMLFGVACGSREQPTQPVSATPAP
jgi:hypothetical protein